MWPFRASATAALEGKPEGEKAIADLLEALDNFIPEPVREIDKPFLMCIEDVFTIEGRGTVVTGRVERGILKKMEEVEIVWHLGHVILNRLPFSFVFGVVVDHNHFIVAVIKLS